MNLVVIDMQSGFNQNGEHEEIIPRVVSRIEQANQAGIGVLLMELRTSQYGVTHESIVCAAEKNEEFRRVEKYTNSGAEEITEVLGLDSPVLITGCNICACVKETVQELLYDYQVPCNVLVDACVCATVACVGKRHGPPCVDLPHQWADGSDLCRAFEMETRIEEIIQEVRCS